MSPPQSPSADVYVTSKPLKKICYVTILDKDVSKSFANWRNSLTKSHFTFHVFSHDEGFIPTTLNVKNLIQTYHVEGMINRIHHALVKVHV